MKIKVTPLSFARQEDFEQLVPEGYNPADYQIDVYQVKSTFIVGVTCIPERTAVICKMREDVFQDFNKIYGSIQ